MELDFEILHGRMLVCWVRHVGLFSEHQTRSFLPVDLVSSILLDYISYVPTKHSSIFKLASGRVLHAKKTTGKVSSAFLTERLYGTDRQNSDSCPNKQEALVEWHTLTFMACVGTLTIFVLFFLSLKVTIFVSCCLDKSMFFFRTREKFMAACQCC